MAVRDDLIDALNICIDRLNRGETLEHILNDYPERARQLRPMLEAGLLFPRVRFPIAEVEAAEAAGETLIRQTISEAFRGGLDGFRWLLLTLLIAAGSVFVALGIAGMGGNAVVLATETATATTAPTQTHTTTASHTPGASPTRIQPVSHTPTRTATTTSTSTQTAAPGTTAEIAQITITGPVSAVAESGITIYDVTLTFAPDDPVLSVLQIGDVVRVDGLFEQGMVQVVNITFLEVLVVVQDGQIWRDEGCSAPPPEWAQPFASAWYERCVSAPPAQSAPGDDRDDDDDDDDDDD